MPRRQQKAVFANLSDGPPSYSAETRAGREKLARKGLKESLQEKKNRIMSDNHLTHRQKMDRIARLVKHSRPSGRSSALVIKVPTGLDRPAFNKVLLEKKQASTNLYEVSGLLLTQEEYVGGLKRPPKGSSVVDAPVGVDRPVFNSTIAKREPVHGTYIRTGDLSLPMKDYRKGVLRNARVRGLDRKRVPVGPTKVTRLPLPEKREAKKLPGYVGPTKVTRLPLENKSFKQLKKQGVNLDARKDTDKDGVPNAKDCRPLNPNKQGILHDIGARAKREYRERTTPEGKRAMAKREYEKYRQKNITAAAERKAAREKGKYEAWQKKKERQRAKKWKKAGKAVKGFVKDVF